MEASLLRFLSFIVFLSVFFSFVDGSFLSFVSTTFASQSALFVRFVGRIDHGGLLVGQVPLCALGF